MSCESRSVYGMSAVGITALVLVALYAESQHWTQLQLAITLMCCQSVTTVLVAFIGWHNWRLLTGQSRTIAVQVQSATDEVVLYLPPTTSS